LPISANIVAAEACVTVAATNVQAAIIVFASLFMLPPVIPTPLARPCTNDLSTHASNAPPQPPQELLLCRQYDAAVMRAFFVSAARNRLQTEKRITGSPLG
jgi:hypothetical protein